MAIDSLVDLVRADVHSEMDGMDSFEQTVSMSNRDHNPKIHRHIDDSEKTMTSYTPYQETHKIVMIMSAHHNAEKLLELRYAHIQRNEMRQEESSRHLVPLCVCAGHTLYQASVGKKQSHETVIFLIKSAHHDFGKPGKLIYAHC